MGSLGYNVKSVFTLSLEASANLSAYQWYGMKLSADGEVTVAASTSDKIIGILTNDPDADGKVAQILVIGVCPVFLGEDVDYGELLRINGSGEGVVMDPGTDTSVYIVGQCLKSGDSGEKGVFVINCGAVPRGV